MSLQGAFIPSGLTVTLTAGLASASCPIRYVQDLNVPSGCSQLRLTNLGTADVWIDINSVGATAAFPTPGTNTPGTPTRGFRLRPGIVEVVTLNAGGSNVGVANAAQPGFFINHIALAAGCNFDITPGEGL